MKLLHVTATHLNPAGGIPVVLRDLVKAQNLIENFEVRVLSVKADVSGMQSVFFDYLGKESFEEYINKFVPDVVVFHCHYYFEYLQLFGCLVRKNIPYYIEPHGSFGMAALQKSKYKKRFANAFVFRSLLKHASGYVFLNENEQKDSKFRTLFDIVIPNGIDISEIDNDFKMMESPFFYFIGRFDVAHKGLDYLFDALDVLEKQHVRVNVKMYGTGSEEEINYVNARIGMFQNVVVSNCGAVYGDIQKRALEQCGIMLLTSRYEGFPMTILEAWKYGNPCVVTPGTNVADEVVSNGLGWKSDLNAESIAETIKQAVIDYSDQRRLYVDRCKRYVTENYGWNAVAQKSYEIFSRRLRKK